MGLEMWRKTIGVVGTGRIGKGVVRRAKGFEMKVLCYDVYPDEAFAMSRARSTSPWISCWSSPTSSPSTPPHRGHPQHDRRP